MTTAEFATKQRISHALLYTDLSETDAKALLVQVPAEGEYWINFLGRCDARTRAEIELNLAIEREERTAKRRRQ